MASLFNIPSAPVVTPDASLVIPLPAPEQKDTPTMEMYKKLQSKNMIGMAKEFGYPVVSQTEVWLDKFITECPLMNQMKEKIRKLSSLSHSVLIVGETGTGKELIAQALHGDRPGPFVGVNCTGLPEQLFESELFGHKKGAFTGAEADKVGLIEHAQNGTIFFDEIARMPLQLQAKLLRFLQEHKIRRVGDNMDRVVNARVVCASQYNLIDGTKTDPPLFLLDLYWRLATFILYVSPLRSRPFDIREIIDRRLDVENKLPENVLEQLEQATLNGNVRELEVLVLRYLTLGEMPT